MYETKVLSRGLHYADIDATAAMKNVFETIPLKTMPDPVKSDLVPLPPGLTAVRPVGDWRIARDPSTGIPTARPFHYLSPDGTTCISAGRDFATAVR